MPRRGFYAVLASAMIGVCGCAGARYVSVDQAGGVVAIPENSNSWPHYYHDQADKLMLKKCPQGYVVDHENEAAIGTATSQRTSDDFSSVKTLVFGGTEQETETHPINEWHIQFHAK